MHYDVFNQYVSGFIVQMGAYCFVTANPLQLHKKICWLSLLYKKTRTMAGSVKVHALDSPRDTAMRSIPELKQFVRKKSSHFLSKRFVHGKIKHIFCNS